MQDQHNPIKASSPYLNTPPRTRRQAAMDSIERDIRHLRAAVKWRANHAEKATPKGQL